MQLINHDDVNEFKEKVSVKPLLETAFTKEISIFMRTGQSMKEHKSPFPILIHLISGKINFGLSGKRQELKSGDIISLDGGVLHDLEAIEDSKIRLTLAKSDDLKRVEKVV